MKTFCLIAAILVVGLTQLGAGEYNYRRCKQLYYFRNGNYYYYNGGDRGQLYYQDGDYFREYRNNHETIVLVPRAIEVEVHRDHYYSIDSASQQSLLADAIVGRMMILMEKKNSGTRSRADEGTRSRASASPSPSTDEGTRNRASETPRMPRADEVAPTGSYQNPELLKAIKDGCVKCHGAASKQTRLITADGKLPDLPAGKVWECFGLVNTGEMPKGGESLADPVVKLFYDWAKKARK